MKKTYSINISGCGFVIDEDAFAMLDSYLATLDEICTRAGEKETAADIEQRIAEVFSERFDSSGQRIITYADVEEIIGRMGRPEEIIDIRTEARESPRESVRDERASYAAEDIRVRMPGRKRLFRDTGDRVLGGVCSGLGWYFNIDPVWVRVIAVAGAFLSASTLAVIYLVLWIVIPAAKTPYQRMQMMGVDPSVENVGKVVTGEYVGRRDVASGIGRILLIVLVGIGLLVVGSLLLAAAVAFIGCLVSLFIPYGNAAPQFVDARLVMGLVMGCSLVVGLPLFLLFRSLLGVLMGRRLPRFTPVQNNLVAIFWVIGLAAVIACGCLL